MQNEDKAGEKAIEKAAYLNQKWYLPGPGTCKCGGNNFKIYKDPNYKLNLFSFSCSNNKCRKKFPININSVYNKLFHHKIDYISEIIKCNICLNMKVRKAFNHLNHEKGLNITKATIRREYYELSKIISKYFKIIYQSELLGNLNANHYYSIYESLIIIIMAISKAFRYDYITKDFRVKGSFNKDTETMKAFITQKTDKGNHIVTNAWAAYNFLDNSNYSYIRYKHVHGHGNF